MADGHNDWIIGDSEEEDQLCSPDRRPVSPVLPEDGVSSIKPFTSMTAEKTSHISSPETDLPARPTISSFPRADLSSISESSSKRGSRPRPRPIFRCAGVDPAANTSTSDPALPCTPTSNHRDQSAIVAHSDPTGTTNTADVIAPAFDSFSPDIAERAKMRTRKATKRSTQYAEEVINITDDDLAITPAKKLKERPKPRPIKRVIPARNNQQLPSDPVTIPVPSSSPPLPPSDPFLNSTPPRPYVLDEIAVPSPSHQGSPAHQKKRKRPDRPRSPADDLADPNRSPTAQFRMAPPPPTPPPPPVGVSDGASGVDLDQNLNSNENDSEGEYVAEKSVKKPKTSKAAERSDDNANARSERREAGKSRKKTIVEVVIMSPRKRASKRLKASRKESSNPAPVEDEDVFGSPQLTSDRDDELMLAPKRRPSARTKSRKGKQKAHEVQSEDNGGLAEIESTSERVAAGEEEREESRTDKHPTVHASTSPTNEHRTSGSHPVENKALVPLMENVQPSSSAQGDDLPKPSPTRETPAPGRLRYTLSRLNQKTPMRELIRRAASHPSAPFSMSPSPVASPLTKTTKTALRRIAPLHPTRRTPPPPPPRPPPPKKSKKMLELEEKWEMELEDDVEGWWALTDEERQDWRRAKRDKELGFDD